jgi:putative resolvase
MRVGVNSIVLGVKVLRPKEVCERHGISYTTLRDYLRRGYLKPVLTPGGRWRFGEEDVEDCHSIPR